MRPVTLRAISQVLMVMTGLCASRAFGDEPEWVRKRPISQEYYVGIGMARKDRPAAEYTEGARNVALNDIASQITVTVSSDVLRTVLEKNEQLEDEFRSRIRASTTADLEEVQLLDTYEDDEQYWVYCRLSKAEYSSRRAGKLNAAATRSFDMYSAGIRHEREGRIGQALGLYAQALGPIQEYLAEPLMVQSGGRSVYLVNEIYGSLRTLLDRIEVRTAHGERAGKIGRPLKEPLQLAAVLRDSASAPVQGLPFRCAFTRGGGECVDQVQTDSRGIARCAVRKVTASDRIQVVEARLDLLALAGGNETSPIVRALLGSFTLPGARFTLNVTGIEVFVDSDESVFGERLQQKRIEPVVTSELGAMNFSFVDDRSRASLLISINANVRRGTESFGLAFAFASATVSVLDLETGQEVFKGSVNDVKEGSDTFEKAAYKSLDTVARRIAGDMVPRLVDKVQK